MGWAETLRTTSPSGLTVKMQNEIEKYQVKWTSVFYNGCILVHNGSTFLQNVC